MKLFRQLSLPRLLALIAAVVGVAVAAGIGSIAALGSSADAPQPKPLDQALEDAVTAPQPEGITARVTFTNNLLPSAALSGLPGSAGSALTSGGSGRLWWSPAGRGRLELQSDAGDTQVVWDKTTLTVWDSSSNSVYALPLAAQGTQSDAARQPPMLAQIDTFLEKLGRHANVAAATPDTVAGEPAYRVSVSPRSGGLVGSLQLAWDATHGVPLDVRVYARNQSTPALALTVTDISFGSVPDSDLSITPPADAKKVDLGGRSGIPGPTDGRQPVTGLDAVQAQVPFAIVAPDTLAGLRRESVRLLDGRSNGALVRYGQGLDAALVVEHAAGGTSGSGRPANLPRVQLDGTTGRELATQLGTILSFARGGVAFVVAGSIPSATAEAAANALR